MAVVFEKCPVTISQVFFFLSNIKCGNLGCQVPKGGLRNEMEFWPKINIHTLVHSDAFFRSDLEQASSWWINSNFCEGKVSI